MPLAPDRLGLGLLATDFLFTGRRVSVSAVLDCGGALNARIDLVRGGESGRRNGPAVTARTSPERVAKSFRRF